MKQKLIIAVFGLLLFISSVRGQENVDLSGFARSYVGVLTGDEQDYSIIQNTFNLNFSNKADKVGFKFNPYINHYFDSKLDFGIREAYVELYFDRFDLRIGKQQIIYGKAEGVFITDVVSPKDLREFLLPDFDEIRMGITAAKLNYYFGNSTMEVVWAPVFTPTMLPEDGSIWRPSFAFPVTPTFDYSETDVKNNLGNSEFFLRYSTMTSKADFEIVGGYFWGDDPVMDITKEIDPNTMQLTGLLVRPEYYRLSMGGASISMPVGPVVIRSEGGYYHGKYFQTETPSMEGSKISRDYLHYMAGVDFTISGIRLSAQFIQEYILNYEEGIQNDEFENTMTFLARKDFLREKLWLELFSYIGFNNEDALIRPKISYSFADGFDIQMGANIFVGEKGRFGQFDANDMVYAKFKYSF